MPVAYRPDKSKVMFAPSTTHDVMAIHVEPTHKSAWREEPFTRIICNFLEQIGKAACVSYDNGPNKLLITLRAPGVLESKPIVMGPVDENGIQWFVDGPSELTLGMHTL